jgi:hypothetical protein
MTFMLTHEERLRRIAKLHQPEQPGGDEIHCTHCEWLWPCPTVQYIPDNLT